METLNYEFESITEFENMASTQPNMSSLFDLLLKFIYSIRRDSVTILEPYL